MKKHLVLIIILLQVNSIYGQTPKSLDTEKELINISQTLMDAVARGDKNIWNTYLDESYLLTDEDGEIKNKAQMLEEIQPLPKGFVGKIEVIEPKIIDMGNTAIIKFKAKEHEELYGQVINTNYVETDTYIKKNDKWKLVASQIMEINAVPKPVNVSKEALKAFEGKYQLTPDIIYTISVEGDKIYGQRGDRPKEELIPGGESILFKPGARTIKLFEKDDKGNIIKMFDRRNGNDLIWKKV